MLFLMTLTPWTTRRIDRNKNDLVKLHREKIVSDGVHRVLYKCFVNLFLLFFGNERKGNLPTFDKPKQN